MGFGGDLPPDFFAGHGGVAGFTKCLGYEWPEVTVRVVDVERESPAAHSWSNCSANSATRRARSKSVAPANAASPGKSIPARSRRTSRPSNSTRIPRARSPAAPRHHGEDRAGTGRRDISRSSCWWQFAGAGGRTPGHGRAPPRCRNQGRAPQTTARRPSPRRSRPLTSDSSRTARSATNLDAIRGAGGTVEYRAWTCAMRPPSAR